MSEHTEQRSKEWFEAKIGWVGGSCIDEVCSKPRKGSKESKTREALKARLANEILTGKAQESYTSWDMQRGIELEPLAVGEYESRTGRETETCGFIKHPSIFRAGASPDRLVFTDGLVEIKCPKLETHLKYARDKFPPAEYRKQMMWEMACSGRKWADFVSYHPEACRQLVVRRMQRDDVLIAELEAEVVQFLEEVKQMVEELSKPEDPLEITSDDITPWADTLEQIQSGKKLSEVK